MTQRDITAFSVAHKLFCEVFEIGLHCILHAREVYPEGAFKKKSKFNVPVEVCIHPAVQEYISSVIRSLRPLVSEARIMWAAVVLLDPNGTPAEKFMFELQYPNPDDMLLEPEALLVDVERQLRSLLLKLKLSPALLTNENPEYSWTVQVKTTKLALIETESHSDLQDFPWIEAEEKETKLPDSKIIPLRSVQSEALQMQLVVEESQK